MAKKKVKQKKKVAKKIKSKSKKIGPTQGNESTIPQHIQLPEPWYHKVLRWFGF